MLKNDRTLTKFNYIYNMKTLKHKPNFRNNFPHTKSKINQPSIPKYARIFFYDINVWLILVVMWLVIKWNVEGKLNLNMK